MNTLDQLQLYVSRLEARLRWLTLWRGAAIAAAAALAATVALVLVTNAFAFSERSLFWARVLLFLVLALAITLALVAPLVALNRRHAARRAEQKFPEFEERLLTLVERTEAGSRDPFLELLAADTGSVAERSGPARLAPGRWLVALASSAAAAVVVLLWLILAGPGYFGYGASTLWGGSLKPGMHAFYDIAVQPGDRLVRRRADQLVTAQLNGFQTDRVRLFARYKGATKWEVAGMQPRLQGAGFEFLFAALPESVEYYVEAGAVRSKSYHLNVVDLAAVRKIRVTYHYPSWLGLKDTVEDPGGDLRAVAGTLADVAVQFDRPLKHGAIVLDDDSQISLSGEGTTLSARVPIEKDGMYHIASIEPASSLGASGSQPVRLSEDFFIEARQDNPPAVKIVRPGRDARVNPIEEVSVVVDGQDDFGLQRMDLHYSVNGGDEKTVPLLASKGVKDAEGKTTLYLEDFKLSPGDVVSLYATASDARNLSRTDMFFVEAQPYEREYSQAQAAGGGGGMGQDENQISQRQKEIIAATWNQLRDQSRNKVQAVSNAQFLSETQSKLRDQAKTLADRMRARRLANANQEFQTFVKEMDQAVGSMGQAAPKLKAQGWKEALGPEQQALQHLLRAESVFRQIQVAFGNSGGGGSGAARDLENLFDLELDTEKNQYETGQQQASQEQRQREIDEALQKLDQLARRQQELADQQRQQKQQTFEQRWQQEMLRREAEQLQRQMEQLTRGSQSAQSSQQGQQGQQGQQSSSSASSQSQSGQTGSRSMGQSAGDRRLQQTLDRLRQATDDMRKAAQAGSNPNGGEQAAAQSEAGARRAAERLQEARDMLNGLRHQEAGQQVDDLANRADRLAGQQKDFARRMQQTYGQSAFGDLRAPSFSNRGADPQKAQQLASEKDQMRKDLEQLERDMTKAARDLAGTQPAASARLRAGLAELQQRELKLRMQFSSNWIRQGRGYYMVPGEATQTEGLEAVRDQVHQAQAALGRSAPKGDKDDLEKTLAQVERLRNQLESTLRRDQPGRQGQQGQQGQSGQERQQGRQGAQPGQQSGQGQQGGQYGQPGGAGYRGGPGPVGSWNGDNTGVAPGPLTAQEMMRDLALLRQSLSQNPDLAREAADLLREIQRNYIGQTQSGLLDERIARQVLPNVEQLELMLRRQVEATGGAQARSGASDPVPPGYADAVAEYFRKLSKGKNK